MAHASGSFDYKTINEKITSILDYRSRLNNTVQVAMPFVKATTTIQLPKFLGVGNYGFTLGVHAIDQDVKTEDIYSSRINNMPLIGYTYGADGQSRRVYAIDPNQESTVKIFDKQASLFTNTDFVRVPPPGITSVNISRMKSGRVGQATINIAVPSLVQLESLHRTFLVPGLGMVLEWGQQFTAEEDRADPGEITDISPYLFPWYDRTKLEDILYKLALNKYGLKNILEEYVYPTDGQYMWMFGRIGNFSVKGNGDGSFDCTVKIVGPAEDSWAYSTKNTIIPAKDPSSQYFCANNTNSVYSYFTETVPGFNFKSILDETIRPGNPWNQHVIRFKQDSADKGKPEENKTEQANTTQKTFADSEDAYFITWRYFVNVILNHPNDGILGVFKKANLTDAEIEKIALLRPYAHGPNREVTNVADLKTYKYVDDPLESFVGMNKYLRSTDPSTLIIVNEEAVKLAIVNPQYSRATSAEKLFATSPESTKMLEAGDFSKSALTYVKDSKNPDRAFLSSGVWLSHKAIIESMIGADTVLRGITNLLDKMNLATGGYWKLSLDVADGDFKQDLGHNYSVIDVNLRETSDNAVDKFLDRVHIFNKYIRVDKESEELVGSELIDCSVDLNLPKLLFSQIATMGLVQPEDLQNAGVDTQTGQPAPKSPKMNPDDRLRKLFAQTSISTTEDGQALADTEKGPDLTILPKKERKNLVATNSCGSTNTNTTALTAGEGNRAGNTPIENSYRDKSVEELKKQKEEAEKELQKEECQLCKNCKSPSPSPTPAVTTQVTTTSKKLCDVLTGTEKFVCERAYDSGITDPTELAQFLAQTKHESQNFSRTVENLNYSADALLTTFPNRFTPDTASTNARKPEQIANIAYANKIGNGGVTSGDGWKYRGRGYIQLTGKDNYAAFANASGKDVLNNPDLVANDRTVAADSAIFYWKTRVKSKTSNFSSTSTVTPYINAASRGLAERTKFYTEFKQKFDSVNTTTTTSTTTVQTQQQTTTFNPPTSTVGTSPYPGPPSLRSKYQNAKIPLSELVRIEPGGLARYGGFLLYPEAAAQYQKMKAAANAQGINWTLTSAYRDFEHQVSLGAKATVAGAGSSPHGWGGAIDLSELYRAVKGSGNPAINASVRSTNKLYNWLATNGPSFGWYNPKRLADGSGTDECWHWEYWGFEVPPKNATPPVPTPTVSGKVPNPSPTPPLTSPASQNTSFCTNEEYLKISKGRSVAAGKEICDKCKRSESIVQQINTVVADKEKLEVNVREFAGFEKVFRYVEVFPEYMLSSITDDADGNRANAFGASPGTLSISADLVMPGINGLRVGELFWIDRMPAFYKAFGAFQIMNIEDTISISDGWKTKVHAVFNYMGEAWKSRMDTLLNPPSS